MQQRRLYANYVGQSLVHVTTVTPHSVFVVVVVVFFLTVYCTLIFFIPVTIEQLMWLNFFKNYSYVDNWH